MKRKVKKFSEGGTNIRTRTDAEFAEDSKHGGYGRYMPKTKEYTLDEAKEKISGLFGGRSKAKEEAAPAEDRPKSSGVEDYASLGKRAPAKSTMSGPIEYITESKAAPEPEEAPKAKGPFSGFDAEKALKESKPTGGGSTSTTGGKDSGGGGGGGSKAKGTKAKKAKLPSNPDAPAYDKTGSERRRGDSQSFAPPPRSGMGPKNTFLTKERSDASKKGMSKGFSMGLFERGDLGIGKKKGGAVKSASARADGCCVRGKTRA
jgi:hypothetical protein